MLKVTEPTFRCGTKKAIDEIAKELNLRNEPNMQDWSYEIARANDIDRYIAQYNTTTDDDKKFVLMEIIIQATEDQESEELFLNYCDQLNVMLKKEFALHEYTVYYWSVFENEHIEDCWHITPFMRELWFENRK
jgi:hypothetical protein